MHSARQHNHDKGSYPAGGGSPYRHRTRQHAWTMPLFSRVWFGLILYGLTCGSVALAQDVSPRLALVVGNAAYRTAPLRNSVNDATDMAAALQQLGFTVTRLLDADQRTMETAIRTFGRQLRRGGVGLFYYAGHGVQVNGINYLIPIGAHLDNEHDVKYEAVDAGRVLDTMVETGNRLNIVILDACRDNPFARGWRSQQNGLVPMQAASGMLIAYATAPGSVAADGAKRNGLYTTHLLQQMRVPGQTVERMFKRVRSAVVSATSGKQIPWESSSLTGDFYFNANSPPPASPPAAVAPAPQTAPSTEPGVEIETWHTVKDSPHAEDFKVFLDAFPHSQYAPLARLKLKQLQRRPAGGEMVARVKPVQQPPQALPPQAPQSAHALLQSAIQARDVAVTETSLAFTVNECVDQPSRNSAETYCVDVRQTVDLRGLRVKKTTRRHWFNSGAAILVASDRPVRRDILNLTEYPGVREAWIDTLLRGSRAGRRRAWIFLKDGASSEQVGQALQQLAR